jgi:hypothetical protein
MADLPMPLEPASLFGGLVREEGAGPFPGAAWYSGTAEGAGLLYTFPQGSLKDAAWVTGDFLVDGTRLVVFLLTLDEVGGGRVFRLQYSGLNQCQARIRMALEAVNQNRWRYEREGAWLKPMCGGDRVDLACVDRMTIRTLRSDGRPVRFALGAMMLTCGEPPPRAAPFLPKGPLLDEFGQSAIHDWPGKTRSRKEVTERIWVQHEAAPDRRWPDDFGRWGGWASRRVEATGFFRTHHDGRRWWLVDPDGHPFWSAGMDCVGPNIDAACDGLRSALTWMPDVTERFADAVDRRDGRVTAVDYLAANFIHVFGAGRWRGEWGAIALAELKRMGFNTVANWSDWRIARAAGFPYVRPLSLRFERTPCVYRDFPDVFHPGFEKDAAEFGAQLEETAADKSFIGYFLMNEPTWGFAGETPAEGMLATTAECRTRCELAAWLKKKHPTDAALAAAWGMPATFARIEKGCWTGAFTARARADLEGFSAVMVGKFFGALSAACRKADPNHLNLGIRYYTVPPAWAAEGMKCFDVFSVNGYDELVRPELAKIAEMFRQPVLVGEWHFGALDAGLPASGIGHVGSQADRGRAYRAYVEDAAAKPWCVGVHWFTLYDESALGRYDGENWNIGFYDTCQKPYEPLAGAARETHERLYRVAAGELEPFADAPQFLPKLFL